MIVSNFVYSQELDKVYLKNKEVISGIILNVSDDNIELNPVGSKPFIIIKRRDVSIIIYSDNTVVKFNEQEVNSYGNEATIPMKNGKASERTKNISKPLPTSEKQIIESLVDTLNNYESEFNSLNYGYYNDRPYPHYLTTFELSELKIKSIRTNYTESHYSTPISFSYKVIWKFSKTGKLLSTKTSGSDNSQISYKYDSDDRLSSKITSRKGEGPYSASSDTILFMYRDNLKISKEVDKYQQIKEISLEYKNILINYDPKDLCVRISILKNSHLGFDRISYTYENGIKQKEYVTNYYMNNDKIQKMYQTKNFYTEYFYEKDDKLSKTIGKNRSKGKNIRRIKYDKNGLVKIISNSFGDKRFNYEFF